MKLQEFKNNLKSTTPSIISQDYNIGTVLLKLEDGTIIPPYYHITEMGIKIKHFVDCGGTLRTKQCVTFQVWTADDFEHRVKSTKTNCLAPDKCGIEKPKEGSTSCCDKPDPYAQGAATCC